MKRERADVIEKVIELSKEKRKSQWIEREPVQADLRWGASQLLGRLFFEAQIIPGTYISEKQLIEFHKEYEQKSAPVDLAGLIEKFWLRIVGGITEIPKVIYSAAKRYGEVRDAEEEFNFLLNTIDNFKTDKTIEKDKFLQFHKETQERMGVAISLEKCKALYFLEEKEEVIKVYNIEPHRPLFRFKDELAFILFICEKEGNKDQLILGQDVIISILSAHKHFFPDTPSIQELELQKVLLKKDQAFLLNIFNTNPDYWRIIGDKIGYHLWNHLKVSGMYPDTMLIHEWVLKMRFINALNWSAALFSPGDLTILLTGCQQLLLNDKDLHPLKGEIDKLILSQSRENYTILTYNHKGNYPDLTEARNVFELFQLLEQCNSSTNSGLLDIQDSRWYIDDLVQLIVFYDIQTLQHGNFYHRIAALLNECMDRPYLLWKTCFYIYYWRPEIIPWLCMNENTGSLAFALYLKSNTDPILNRKGLNAEMSLKISVDIFSLILTGLSEPGKSTEADKALILFECLQLVCEKKVIAYRNNETVSNIEKRNHLQKLSEEMYTLLSKQALPGMIYDETKHCQKKLFPDLVPDLFQLIDKYNAVDLYPNGVIGLPIIKLELLTLLLDLITSPEYETHPRVENSFPVRQILNSFVSAYTGAINTQVIKKENTRRSNNKEGIPIWSTFHKGTDIIPWEKWALHLENENLLADILTPLHLKLEKANDKYDRYNQFVVDKLRIHLEILILVYLRLRENQFSYKQQGFRIDSALTRLELTIGDFIDLYSTDEPEKARLDIFEERYERPAFGSEGHALIPDIARALNHFEPRAKEKILQSLVKNESLPKCLKLLEYLSNEADRDVIKKQISKLPVADYLNTKRYIPEIEIVVTKLAEYSEFIDKAKEALDYWKQRVLSNRNQIEQQITYYRIRLLIAYYEGDEETINSEPAPPVDSFSTSGGFEFKPAETRSFYLGLVKLKKDEPVNAYAIFNRILNTSKNDKPAVAINRLYAHISLALKKEDTDDKQKSLTEALTEWQRFEDSLPLSGRKDMLDYVKENIWINKLTIFHELQRQADFDQLFYSFEKHYQLRKDFFELRTRNLIDRLQYEVAKYLVAEAKQYHQLKDGGLPDFIKVAAERLEDEEDFRRLRKEYQHLITRSPEKLIEILPENLALQRNLSGYILQELASSANGILDIVNSAASINNEDKYTDLLILSLASKFRNWYWSVGNTRGGFSASNKRNSGELDFVISSANNERLATCEALLIHGKNTSVVSEHVIKTFNYDHRRTLFFIIVYYNGKNFSSHWNDYKTNIVSAIQYPQGFPLTGTVTEINEPFTNHSVQAIKTKHGNETEVFHLGINLNYKIDI